MAGNKMAGNKMAGNKILSVLHIFNHIRILNILAWRGIWSTFYYHLIINICMPTKTLLQYDISIYNIMAGNQGFGAAGSQS